jgi:proliferating cell nuclear antigen
LATTIILTKKGELDIERGLQAMDWDTEAFERELELFAKTQPSRVQEKLRKQYNRFIKQCGMPWKLVVEESVPKLSGPEPLLQLPKKEPLPELPKVEPQQEPVITPQAEPIVKTEIPPQTVESIPEKQETESPIPIAVQEPKKELHGHIIMRDARQVKNLLKTVGVLVDEATFKLTPQGLTLRAMDPSRVAMIDLAIPREGCEEHLCPEEIKFCFSIDRYLQATLKNINKEDAVRIDINTGLGKMNTRLFGKLTRQFSMPLLEGSDEEAPRPKLDFKYSAKLVLEDVNTLFKDNVSDHVRIVGTQDGLTFEETGDLENLTVTLQKGGDSVLNIEAKEDAKATYAVSYLKEFLKELKSLTDIIEVSYSTDIPMRISADLGQLGTISFYVAPRITSDD